MPKTPKNCVHCHKALVGKQTRFCSKTCHDRHWYEARTRGEGLPPLSTDEDTQRFMEDFLKLLTRHGDVVDKIIRRSRPD